MTETSMQSLVVTSAVKAMVGPAPINGAVDEDKDYNAAMHAAVLEILDTSQDFGFVGGLVKRLTDPSIKSFVVPELLAVTAERSSKRYVIEARSDKPNKDKEYLEGAVRTNRVDDWKYGPGAKELGLRAKELIGHRCMFTVRLEEMASNGNKVRIIEQIRDLGLAKKD